VHFGFESSRGPSLKKAGGNSIADFKFGHPWTDRNDLTSSVREWYPPFDRMAIVVPAQNDQVAIVERYRLDPYHHLMIAGIWQRPIHYL
jgi:hypothetical protein